MTAMIKINFHTAQTIWRYGDSELFELYEDGSEGLVTESDDLKDDRQYGIEGELFGKPYGGRNE